ncbi:MAG: 1-acyl-sn-glycerol-3-phosphate acyltransferase [Proteobacteria bacterium]|nr:1-acyl-sn-glycerol-3-phosphate acyltransferase [Pseudomonadota bacterium]
MTLLRSVLFNAWFFGITTVLSVIGAASVAVAPASALPIARLWARLVLAGLRPLCGIRWEVRGREHLLPEGPLLIASRHQSAFDTMVWLLLLPRCTYVLKQELTRIPLFGRMFRPAGQIVLDRSGGTTALRALARDASAAAKAGGQIVIFPEGTRAAPDQLLPLQPGIAAIAIRTGLPVTPVVTDSGRLWGRRAFRKRPGVIHVTVLPPLAPPAGGAGARDDFMRRLAEALETDPERCG